MHKFGLLVVAGAVILSSVAWVEGQGGGNPFGRPQTGPLDLLNREDVKKELGVTEAQLEKLSPEVLKAIAKVLDDKQFKRFKQIDLQKRGNDAFKDEAVQKELKITADQKKSITSLLEDADKEIKDLAPKGGKGGGVFGKGGAEARTKQDNVRKEYKEKIFSVLSKDQRKTYRELIGDEFTFVQQTFGKKDATPDPKKKDQE